MAVLHYGSAYLLALLAGWRCDRAATSLLVANHQYFLPQKK
ncbi:MAG: hypothetical protein WA885_22145 [Phormidesmis sp.]